MTFRSSLVLVMDSPKNKSGDSPDGGGVADVTGVSRSGRVRKKSSKLTDFESPDEIDIRFKRKTERPPKSPQKILKQDHTVGGDMYDDSDGYIDDDLLEIKDEPLDVDDWGEDDDDEMDVDDNDGGDIGGESLHVDEDSTDLPRETSNFNQSQSLYLSEKQAKKSIMLKDGQVVQRKKAQRKDKGKSRFTAYMLWAREVRPGIIQANPQMDFSAVNKRLGELWALVPTSQKYNWKRRAKRLAAKGNQKGSMISTGKAAKQPGNIARSNLINKGGVKPQQAIRSSKPAETSQAVAVAPAKTPVSTSKSNRNTTSSAADPSPPITYKVTGRTPIDVAAHIKLLGESLNNIGQKLKEHEDISGNKNEAAGMEKPDSDADLVEADGDRANDNETGPNKKVAVMKPPLNTAKRVKKRVDDAQGTSEISLAISQLDNIAKIASDEKPFDQFGRFVACELRSLNPREAILLQQKIQNCIIESKLNS